MHVLLVDNRTHVRASIHFLLEQQTDIHIVETADASTMLLEQTYAQKPAIILISWDLWQRLGNELLKTLRGIAVRCKLLVFSSRPEVQQAALQSGADAFFCAYDPPDALLNTLQTLAKSLEPAEPPADPLDSNSS